jgi:putative membrane protein
MTHGSDRQGETETLQSARRPRVIALDDPAIAISEARPNPQSETMAGASPDTTPDIPRRFALDLESGFRWGALLASALFAATMLAASLWFYRFVSVGLEREDWIGWAIRGLMAIAVFALVMLALREIVGFSRIGHLNRLRDDIAAARNAGDAKAERKAVISLRALYNGRDDLVWRLKAFDAHMRDVHDAGSLFVLADREIMSELDGTARRLIMQSAKRVATVTAMSPMMVIAVVFVGVENLRLLRRLATLYGGRPGLFALLRLARMVVAHLVATGGVALTDDLLGQFIGQDLVRRLSRRLGEGAFNGALTARVGVAAIDLIRPLPFIEARAIRVRDIVIELFGRAAQTAPPKG